MAIGNLLPGPPGHARVLVSGKLTDRTGKIYSVCRVELLYPARKSWLNSEREWLGGDHLMEFGKFALLLSRPAQEKEVMIEVSCRGAKSGYRSPVIALEKSRDINLGEVVLERTATPDFQEALCARDVRRAKQALSGGQDPNAVFANGFGKGHTPLSLALRSYECDNPASLELVSLLVENGAKVNKNKNTIVKALPISIAVQSEDVQLIEYLLQKGADVNARDVLEKTPLLNVAEKRSERSYKIAEILLRAGADPHARSFTGETADVLAERWEQPHVAELIRRAQRKQ